MKTLNLKEMEMIEGGGFWGWDCSGPPMAAKLSEVSSDGNQVEFCQYNCTYFVFGIGVKSEPHWDNCPSGMY